MIFLPISMIYFKEKEPYFIFCIPFAVKCHAMIIIIIIKIGIIFFCEFPLCSRFQGDIFPKLPLIITAVLEGGDSHFHFTDEGTQNPPC